MSLLTLLLPLAAFAYTDGEYACQRGGLQSHVKITTVNFARFQAPYVEAEETLTYANGVVEKTSLRGFATVQERAGREFLILPRLDNFQAPVISFFENAADDCAKL